MSAYKENGRNANNEITFEKECFDWVGTIINAIAILVIIFTIFIKLIVVNGVSMMPTLQDKDWMVLSSFLYVPEKGDIVVVNKKEPVMEPIIKRIVATENDSIDIRDGKVYINDELKDESKYIGDAITNDYGDMRFPQVVPKGCYFVLGDNRENSLDSRFEKIGFISRNEILGKAKVVIFPFDRFKIT